MLNQYLQQLGFSEKEIAVYLSVLENGKIGVNDLARLTKINRTTVYSVSKVLIAKNVIHEDLGGANRYFVALDPDELRRLYRLEEEALRKKKDVIDNVIKELEAMPKSKQYSVPKIRFIDEAQLNDFLFKQLPVWIESAKQGDKNWWGFQDASFIAEYPEFFDLHYKIFPADYGTHLITNKKPAEKDYAKKLKDDERREVKYWDKTVTFTATHAVLGDYVLFVVTDRHPHYLVETHDAVMAQNLREMFKGIWKII